MIASLTRIKFNSVNYDLSFVLTPLPFCQDLSPYFPDHLYLELAEETQVIMKI